MGLFSSRNGIAENNGCIKTCQKKKQLIVFLFPPFSLQGVEICGPGLTKTWGAGVAAAFEPISQLTQTSFKRGGNVGRGRSWKCILLRKSCGSSNPQSGAVCRLSVTLGECLADRACYHGVTAVGKGWNSVGLLTATIRVFFFVFLLRNLLRNVFRNHPLSRIVRTKSNLITLNYYWRVWPQHKCRHSLPCTLLLSDALLAAFFFCKTTTIVEYIISNISF